jgi:hypothetical protein
MLDEQELLSPSSEDVNNFFQEIERGRLGLNLGLSMGFPRLDEFICGVQKSRYDLIFAQEKAGKSSFVTSAYILNPYSILKKIDKEHNLKVFYFSLEMSKNAILSKWFADRLYTEYKILIDPNIILGKKKGILPDYIYDKLKLIASYYEEMLATSVTIIDESLNPTGIYKAICKYAEENGRIENKRYIPNNPDQTVIIIIDTAGNLKTEKVEGVSNLKSTIDKMSEYNRFFRNKFNYTPVMVMHANRGLSDYAREKGGDVYPKSSDIKESGQPIQDCNLCMCVFDPTPFLDRPSIDIKDICGGYDPYKLNRRFRSIGILTNRDGDSFVKTGMVFIGETGRFYELPKTSDMNDTVYNKICKIQKINI